MIDLASFPFRRLRQTFIIVGLTSLLLLTSCYPVKINEVVTLEKNGSSTAHITYGIYIPSSLSEISTKKQFEEINKAARATTGISDFDLRISTEKVNGTNVLLIYRATIGFTTLSSLGDLAKEISQCPEIQPLLEKSGQKLLIWNGKLKSFLSPNKATLTRTFPLPPANTAPPVRMTLSAPGNKAEPDFLFLYTLPEKPEESNAQQVLNDGKTLLWTYNFKDIPQEQPNMSLTLSPWYILPQNTLAGLAGLLTGAIIATIFTILRRVKKKREKAHNKATTHITA